MTSRVNFGKFVTGEPIEIAILLAVGAAAIYFVLQAVRNTAAAAADSVAAGVGGVVGAGAGIATGNNVVTAGTPYEGTGFVGTIAAAENSILGGAPAAFGNWLGGKLADWSSNTDDGTSSSNQGATGSPFNYGTSSYYGTADDSAPKQATVVASPGATGNSW